MAQRRYVILHHEVPKSFGRPSHFDLMLELGDSLKTWSFAELPEPGRTVPALALPPHRLEYLDYQGPVSGDRGNVEKWDSGRYVVTNATNHTFTLEVSGERIKGRLELTRIDGDDWTCEIRIDK